MKETGKKQERKGGRKEEMNEKGINKKGRNEENI